MKKSTRRSLAAFAALCLCATPSFVRAQEVDPPAAVVTQDATQPPATQTPTIPPTVVETTPDTGPFIPGDGDSAGVFEAFPSLSNQLFNGLDSASRGLPKSIFEQPNNSTIIDRELIREKQSQSVFQALQYESGVLVQQTGRGQASPFIRGLTGQQILVLVDGIRTNTSVLRSGPNQYANLFDPGSIDRIEVVRGSQSVMWGGDALGGVINIVTRSADPFRGDYHGTNFIQYLSSADKGSYSRGSIEGWVGNSGVFTGGSYLDMDNLDRGGGLGPQPFTEYSQYAGDVKYNYIVSEDDLLTLCLQHFEQTDLPRSDRFQPFVSQNNPLAAARPTFFSPQQRDMIYLRMQGNGYNAFFDGYSHAVSWQRNKEGSSELQGTALTTGEFDVSTWGYTLTLMKDFEQYGTLSYGGDYYNDAIDSVRSRRANANAPFLPVRSAQYPDDATYDRAGIYANWDLQVTDRLNVMAGGRYENVNASGTPIVTLNGVPNQPFFFENSYHDWVGSTGFVYEVRPELNFVGGIYEGFRAPSIDDLTADKTFLQNAVNVPSLGSLAVQPEHSLTYELGLKFDTPKLRGQLYQWWMEIDDYITRFPDANNIVVLGNSQARLHGTELAGEYLFTDVWSVYGNFWYTWGDDVQLNEPFPRIPPTQGVTGLRWRAEDRSAYADLFTWMVADFDPDRYTPANRTDARFPTNGQPGYATLNLRLGKSFGDDLQHRVSLTLSNMTDKYYRVLGSGVDGEGFNATLGYEWLH